jgi:hypothetical protein
MQTHLQYRFDQMPSLRTSLSVAGLAIAVLGLSVFVDRAQTPQSHVAEPFSVESPVVPSRVRADATTSLATDGRAQDGRQWASDVMDSHESVPSLAALENQRTR